jgi:acyl-CoA reductase-like NAD-dependent aldehyde dehydrogenase
MTPTATKSTPEVSILKQYIGGKWVDGSSSKEIVSTNPADSRQVLAKLKGADKSDVLKAIDAAQKAFPAWKATTPPARGRILMKAALLLRERKEELARLMTREQGKILPEAMVEME